MLSSSVSDPDPHRSAFNWSPGSGSGKRAKMKRRREKKNAAKRKIIRHKKYKKSILLVKNVYCDLIFIKNLTLIF
jgi:hypothetical protein